MKTIVINVKSDEMNEGLKELLHQAFADEMVFHQSVFTQKIFEVADKFGMDRKELYCQAIEAMKDMIDNPELFAVDSNEKQKK